jgi:hypothetical protein
MKKYQNPLRQCIACHETQPKKELLRIVRTPDHQIMMDHKGKQSGRGAYIGHSFDCLMRAKHAHALEQAFGMDISEDTYAVLEQNASWKNTNCPFKPNM